MTNAPLSAAPPDDDDSLKAMVGRVPLPERIIDLGAELLTIEARMGALGYRGGALRRELSRRGAEVLEREGMAPTWRAPALGVITYRNPEPKVGVIDQRDWSSWAAERYPTEVTAVIRVNAADLEQVLARLATGFADEPDPIDHKVELEVNPAWSKVFLSKAATADVSAGPAVVLAPETGEVIDGVGLIAGGTPGVSVRLDQEAKARAAAEMGDPVAVGILSAPLGGVASPPAPRPPADVDDAAGEPDELPPVPLDPVGAAIHASTVQGGFSTPPIEAFRILSDALRTIDLGAVLDERWREGVRATLRWLEENVADPEVVAELDAFERRNANRKGFVGWRKRLEVATVPPVNVPWLVELLAGRNLDAMKVTELEGVAERLGLSKAGRKRDLVGRIRNRIEQAPVDAEVSS